jgi:hypothetical protein
MWLEDFLGVTSEVKFQNPNKRSIGLHNLYRCIEEHSGFMKEQRVSEDEW